MKVQFIIDLYKIWEKVVIPLTLVIPNHATILISILASAKYFSVIDLFLDFFSYFQLRNEGSPLCLPMEAFL